MNVNVEYEIFNLGVEKCVYVLVLKGSSKKKLRGYLKFNEWSNGIFVCMRFVLQLHWHQQFDVSGVKIAVLSERNS